MKTITVEVPDDAIEMITYLTVEEPDQTFWYSQEYVADIDKYDHVTFDREDWSERNGD